MEALQLAFSLSFLLSFPTLSEGYNTFYSKLDYPAASLMLTVI